MYIRKYQAEDVEKVLDVWYDASIQAHSFISKEFWAAQKKDLREKYLPQAESWVAIEEGEIVGFISLLGDYIGGLFIAPNYQGRGIGKKLVAKALETRKTLEVGVYKKNVAATSFYKACGFEYVNEEFQPETGEIVLNMIMKG